MTNTKAVLLAVIVSGAPLGSSCGAERAASTDHRAAEPTHVDATGGSGSPESVGGEGGATLGSEANGGNSGSAEAGGASGAPAGNVCADETRTVDYAPGLVASGSQRITVTLVTSVPGPPVVGNNVWELLIEDEAGQAVAGAEVAVTPFMPDHRHGSPLAVVVTEQGDGYYRAKPLNFSMPGYWNTRVQVVTDSWEDTAAFKLCMAGQ